MTSVRPQTSGSRLPPAGEGLLDPALMPPNYPRQWEADVVLRDGSVAHVRPIVPSDVEGIKVFHAAQSEESIYLRFFAPIRELSEKDLYRFTHVDYHDRGALVVTVKGMLIGIGRWDRLADGQAAEVAFNIADAYQGKGVGSVLLEHLAAVAQEHDIAKFVADVLPQNRKMMKVFQDAGYEISHHFDDGVIAVEFQIAATSRSAAVSLSREHRAEAESMAEVLRPESVAIVGVGRRPDSIGGHVLDNILDGGYAGRVHIVNSEARQIRGIKSHDKVSDIDDDVELAVIAVQAHRVLEVVSDCAAAGVKAIVVISGGFGEAGPEGEELQRQLLTKVREAGMRLLGPVSLGYINNQPDVLLNATISRQAPAPGAIGLFSQSAGLAVGLLASVARRRLGVSQFVAAGNRVDVSGNDLMQFWIDDETTLAVGMYLESIGNPRKFNRIARQLSLRKPVIVVKTETSRAVPPGHRVRTPKVPSSAFDALLAQAGAIQAHNVSELTDIAELVAHQPLPAGDRVAIVGTSDGVNRVVTEAVKNAGLRVWRSAVKVPLGGTAMDLARALDQAFSSDEVDSVVVTVVPPMQDPDERFASTLAHAAWGHDKPCVATFMGMRDVRHELHRGGEPGDAKTDGQRRVIPLYRTPLDGIRALAAVTRYATWLQRDHGEPVRPPRVDRTTVEDLIEEILTAHPEGVWVDDETAGRILGCYGIEVWPTVLTPDAEAAVAAADALGYPVVVRSMADGVRNNPGSGGVQRDLRSAAGVRAAYDGLSARLSAYTDPKLGVQRMATPGVATVIRSHEDPLFGPVVSFGLAGVASELLGDVSYRFPPLTDLDAREMVSSLRAAQMLEGYRGNAPADKKALEDILLRVAALADDHQEIGSLELNPVNAHAGGVEVLGVRLRVAPTAQRKDTGRRALA